MEEYKDEYTARDLQQRLGTILDGFEGKIPEEKADNIIDRSLHASLSTFYMEKNGINKIQDEEKRKKLNGLMEYVAAGLDVDRISENYEKDINATEAQKANIKAIEEQGRIEVAKEKEEAKRQAEKAALEAKSGLNVLDEHKAEINKLPKTFRGPGADIQEAEARQKLKGLCIDILAIRRSIGAKRNDKAGLAKVKMDDPVFQKMTPMGDQRRVYTELLAARAAVASKRGDKNSLRRPLDAKILAGEREKFKEGPLATALARMTMMGGRQQMTSEVATAGHGGELEAALEKEQFEKDVNTLMKDYLFKEVCGKLGERGLAEQAKGDGLKLFDSYNLAREDKLEFYNPNKPVVKDGPVQAPKKPEEVKGPQMGGIQA